MVNEDKLSAVLGEFARTMITDFPIQRILDRLVDRIVDVLPITSAGVTLITEGSTPHYIAASDDSALQYETLQSDINEGPCLEAFHSGHAVAVPNLDTDDRFPKFSPAAVEAGLAAVFTFPLFHGLERFGALDLYRDMPGDLDAADMMAAQTLADVAAALLLNAKAREDALAISNRFHYHAMHDPLTGLPNRLLLQERMERAAMRSQRTQTYTAVLFLDLDRFKQVNDTHGHLVGDQLLRAVAQRLSALVRSGDTLSRFSGDEFVFLCEALADVDDVSSLVTRINKTFAEPFRLDGVELTVCASVGTAYVGPGEAITSELLIRADLDMYRAKSDSARARVVRINSARLSPDDQSLAEEVRGALEGGQLEVAYQPIVRTSDDCVNGVEALVRWTHPHRGPIAPLTMVSVAERSDLICGIGAWILDQACRDHAAWMGDHPDRPLDLAVNVSVRQLLTPDFYSVVSAALSRTGMDSHSLVLELTESIAMEHSARIIDVLVGLSELGIRLALDDFGTGYSSLSYLSRLPIDIVKIDRSFIAQLDHPSGRIVVAAVTDMAHELGLEVVAEGVETETQRQETIAVGCDYTQGYLHARPMSSENIREFLAISM
ncbi:MAG TPA: EAL domain-containing protein [Ilumatobacter sp.]|nr:EAL domain-containing protein [Ilumatobacter sp.]